MLQRTPIFNITDHIHGTAVTGKVIYISSVCQLFSTPLRGPEQHKEDQLACLSIKYMRRVSTRCQIRYNCGDRQSFYLILTMYVMAVTLEIM